MARIKEAIRDATGTRDRQIEQHLLHEVQHAEDSDKIIMNWENHLRCLRTGSPSWKDKEKKRNGSRVFTPIDTKLQRLEGKVHVSSENFNNSF